MIAASRAFRDQKETPLERALWWIEWAMRNPNPVHFESPATELNFIHIQSIDVIAFLTLISVMIIFALFIILRKLLKFILHRTCQERSKSKHD